MPAKYLQILICALFFIPCNTYAQGEIYLLTPKLVSRMHFGYSFQTVNATQQSTARVYSQAPGNPDSIIFQDFTASRPVRTLGGYGLTVGSFATLTRFRTEIAALAVSFDLTYNFMSWEELDSGFNYRPKLKDFKVTDFTGQFTIPVSLDFKLGADAKPTKNYKWAAAFGVGIAPVIAFVDTNKNVFKKAVNTTLGYTPFIKFEGGRTVASFLVKLRLAVLLGGPKYLEEGMRGGATMTGFDTYSLTGKGGINLSLIVYPASYEWLEYGWWGKPDTKRKVNDSWW